MPMMTLMLLASVLPLSFPLLNLSVRDRNDALCQPLKTLKWRFCLSLLFFWHARNLSRMSISFKSKVI